MGTGEPHFDLENHKGNAVNHFGKPHFSIQRKLNFPAGFTLESRIQELKSFRG